MNVCAKQKQTHRYRKKLVVNKGEKKREEQITGINRYKLLCMK